METNKRGKSILKMVGITVAPVSIVAGSAVGIVATTVGFSKGNDKTTGAKTSGFNNLAYQSIDEGISEITKKSCHLMVTFTNFKWIVSIVDLTSRPAQKSILSFSVASSIDVVVELSNAIKSGNFDNYSEILLEQICNKVNNQVKKAQEAMIAATNDLKNYQNVDISSLDENALLAYIELIFNSKNYYSNSAFQGIDFVHRDVPLLMGSGDMGARPASVFGDEINQAASLYVEKFMSDKDLNIVNVVDQATSKSNIGLRSFLVSHKYTEDDLGIIPLQLPHSVSVEYEVTDNSQDKLKVNVKLSLNGHTRVVPISISGFLDNRPADLKAFMEKYPLSVTFGNIINDSAFKDVSIPSDFKFPTQITVIGANAFEGATLPAGFTIPATVTSIGPDAFKNVVFPNGYYWVMDGTNKVSVVSDGAHKYFVVNDLDLFIARFPAAVVGGKIVDNAFKSNVLSSDFSIPSGITAIGANAFEGVTLPAGFTIPATVTSIGANAFNGATLPAGFTIPATVTSIGANAFNGATLPAEFAIPAIVTSIGADAFNGVIIPAGYAWASGGKKVSSVIGAGLAYKIENDVEIFDEAWPGAVVNGNEIRSNAFPTNADRPLVLGADFIIPSWITKIDADAFDGVVLDENFTIPATVTSIDVDAFKFSILPSPFGWLKDDTRRDDGSFAGGHKYVVTKNEDIKKISMSGWTPFPLSGSVTNIFMFGNGNDAYYFNLNDDGSISSGLSHVGVTLPSKFVFPEEVVTSISDYAFFQLILPPDLSLPPTITSIGEGAFQGATLPLNSGFHLYNVTSIGSGAFMNTVLPVNFTIPPTVIFIGDNAFKETTLPSGFTLEAATYLKDLSYGVFAGARLPIGFTVPASVTTFGSDVFAGAILPSGTHWTCDGVRSSGPIMANNGGHLWKVVLD